MRNYIKPFFIAAIFSISSLMAYADEEIPIEVIPEIMVMNKGKRTAIILSRLIAPTRRQEELWPFRSITMRETQPSP